jgi:hypothetical protein
MTQPGITINASRNGVIFRAVWRQWPAAWLVPLSVPLGIGLQAVSAFRVKANCFRAASSSASSTKFASQFESVQSGFEQPRQLPAVHSGQSHPQR